MWTWSFSRGLLYLCSWFLFWHWQVLWFYGWPNSPQSISLRMRLLQEHDRFWCWGVLLHSLQNSQNEICDSFLWSWLIFEKFWELMILAYVYFLIKLAKIIHHLYTSSWSCWYQSDQFLSKYRLSDQYPPSGVVSSLDFFQECTRQFSSELGWSLEISRQLGARFCWDQFSRDFDLIWSFLWI